MAGLVTVLALIRYGPGTNLGHQWIAAAVSGTKVGDVGRLSIEGLAGDPWSEFSIQRARIVDERGAWLDARRIGVHWRPEELLKGRVRLMTLTAGDVSLLRQPQLKQTAAHPDASSTALRIDQARAMIILTPGFATRAGAYRVSGGLDLEGRRWRSGRIDAVSLTRAGDYLKAGFAMSSDRLSIDAHAQEAQGGAMAGSLGLDARQAFALDAHARGQGGAGWFSLKASSGAISPAAAQGRWSPAGGEVSGVVDLIASRWLAPWRAALGPTATFSAKAVRSGPDLYATDVVARGRGAALTMAGPVDLGRGQVIARGVDVRLSVANLSTLSGLPGLGAATFGGRLTGGGVRWTLEGQASVVDISAQGVRLAKAAGPVALSSEGSGLALKARLDGSGGAGGGLVGGLLGSSPRAEGEIDWLNGGGVLLRRFSLHGAGIDVTGRGERGFFGDLAVSGATKVTMPAAVGLGPRGLLTATWQGRQGASGGPWRFSLSGQGSRLESNASALSAALGPAPTLKLDGRLGGGSLMIDQAALRGAVALSGSGAFMADHTLRGTVQWTSESTVDFSGITLSGPSRGSGVVQGSWDQPRLDTVADIRRLQSAELPGAGLRDSHLTLELVGEGAGYSGHAGLAGVLETADAHAGAGPARAETAFQLSGGALVLSDLTLEGGGASLRGSATLNAWRPVVADLRGSLGPGLLLAGGHLAATARLVAGVDGPTAQGSIKGEGLTLPGGTRLASLSITATGPVRRLDYRVEASGGESDPVQRLSGSGLVSAAKGEFVASFSGLARVGDVDARTAAPARLSVGPKGAAGQIRLTLAQAGGHPGGADVSFVQTAAALAVHARVSGLGLSLFDPNIIGSTDGALEVTRVGDTLAGTAQLKVSGLAARDDSSGAPLAGTLNARFGGGVIALDAELADAKGSTESMDLRLPATLSASPLQVDVNPSRQISGHFAINGAVAPLWALASGGDQAFSGQVQAQGVIEGTLDDPRFTGAASLRDGVVENAGVGLRASGLSVDAALRGDLVEISHLAANDGSRGSLIGSGRLSLVRGGVSSFHIDLKGFRLFDTRLGQAWATGPITVERAADGRVRLAGALNIDQARFSPTPPVPSGVIPMEVTEINRPLSASGAAPSAPLSLRSGADLRPPPATLDIALRASGGLFIKGRGLNLEMSLDSRVTGTTTSPTLSGSARVVRGDYEFAGQRFQIDDRGVVYLGSTPETIHLDLSASRENPALTAQIQIKGTAAKPLLTLTSNPVLPNDEILSQVLFGASAAQLSGLQAAQLASAVASLAGGGGFDVMGGLRNFAHLDHLAFDSQAATGVSVAGGKYISDKVYVELSEGARAGPGAQVEWRLRKHLALVSRVTSQGDRAISIRWRRDY